LDLRKSSFILVFSLILLFSVAAITLAETKPEFNLTFQDSKVNAEIKLLVKNDVKYLNLPFYIKYARTLTDWQPETGVIRMRFGKNAFLLGEDKPEYTVNGRSRKLSAAPFEQDGQLWLPLDLLAEFHIVVKQANASTLALGWDDDYLLDIEAITYEGRPAFVITGTRPLKLNSFLLTQPDRLVLDFMGMKAHPAFDPSGIQHPRLQKIRFNQFQADTLRLVCDFEKLSGYKIINDPANENSLILVFNYLVSAVNFFDRDGEKKVQVVTDYPAKYSLIKLDNPARAVIDFDGATLDIPGTAVEGDGQWANRVRMSQYNLQTVRVVVDLADPRCIFNVVRARNNPKLVEVRALQYVKAIDWIEPTSETGQLVLTGTGELDETIRRVKKPDKLLVDLNFFQFAPGLKAPPLNQISQIKGIRLIKDGPTTARVEVDLNYFVGYETGFSEDYRQLTLTFVKSSVIGKSIVLDAGHGGVDMGATGRQGTREKNINLDITMRLKDYLEEAGADVVLTRNDDYFISLFERSFTANNLHADLFVSLHANSHPSKPEVRGLEVYYYAGRTEAGLLAKKVEKRLVDTLLTPSLGVKTDDFAVIRETMMPSILVEVGYLSNFQEENLINTDGFKDGIATGVFKGVLDYCKTLQ
jgi:N-acetylmuramoyl-L-alanine amidase